MNIKSAVITIILLSLILSTAGCFGRAPFPADGNVSSESFTMGEIIELSGLWEFYPGKFYLGDDFNSSEAATEKRYIKYNAKWGKTVISGREIPNPGYGTYRLNIRLPEEIKEGVSLRIPYYDMAVNIYCNSRLLYSNGETGTTADTTKTISYYPLVKEASPVNSSLEIVIHASNFHFYRGGIREPILLGYGTSISRFNDFITAIEMMLIGCLLIMWIYDTILFLVLKRNPLYLYFALACLAAALHAMVNGSSLLGRLGVTWERLVIIRYLTWIAAVYFYYMFFTRMFKNYNSRAITYLYTASAVVCCVVIILTPFSTYNNIYYPVTALYLFSILYFLGASLNEFIHKRKNSGLLLASFIIIVLSLFIDRFTNFAMNRYNIVSPVEIVLFCIIQSIIIGKNVNVQFRKNSELTAAIQQSNAELTMLNKHLELIVAEKTDKLKRQNAEISEQNRRIMDMNLHLEERVKTSIEDLRQKDDMLTISARQAAMGEMLGFIGHQWKQNIYAISLYTEALKNLLNSSDEFNKVSAKESLDKIDSFVIAMFNTFNNFNNFIKPSGEAELFSIKGAVEETIALMHDFITINSVTIKYDYSGDPVLEGLSNEVEQVVVNIIKNSIDAFNERMYADRKLLISVYTEDGINYLRIKDNAGGINLDNPSDVFDKFRTSKKSGTGLGLYIAKIIIEQRFGGRIEARNTDEGAEFIIAIPVYGEQAINPASV